MPNVSTLKLNNDVEMPALGLGVFQTPAEKPEPRSKQRFLPATGTSTRQLPTATRRQVGEAVRSSGLDRSEVFLETKIWIATTATTRRCTASTRAPASSESTRSTC